MPVVRTQASCGMRSTAVRPCAWAARVATTCGSASSMSFSLAWVAGSTARTATAASAAAAVSARPSLAGIALTTDKASTRAVTSGADQ